MLTRLRAAASTRFSLAIAGICLLALVIRVVTAVLGNDLVVWNDASVYQLVGHGLADGQGFRRPFSDAPTAEHPPLWEIVLAGAYRLGLHSTLSHRLIGSVIGTLTVALVGLLGRRVGGDRLGLAAAAVAAVYPPLWTSDMTIMSETLYGALLAGALLAALHRRPIALGVLLGLAALTRGEALALLPLLAVALFWRRWRQLVLSLVACVVVLTPWTVRNLVTFDQPVLISTNSGSVVAGANCDAAYHGTFIGTWVYDCYSDWHLDEDESEYFARQQQEGLQYATSHASRLPVVVGARLLRLLNAWDPRETVYQDTGEGRPHAYTWLSVGAFWLLLPFAVAGAVLLRRRQELLVLGAPVVMVVLVAMTTYGSTRLRFGAEPSLVVLAGVALVALMTRVRTRAAAPRHRAEPT